MTNEKPNVQTREGQEQMKALGIKPLPDPDATTQPYWDAAMNEELKIQFCSACNQYQHPPMPTCERCEASKIEWRSISGKGIIYSFIIDRRLMTTGFDEPYVVAQINPIEAEHDDVRITTNIKGCELTDVYMDMPVEVFFEEVNGVKLPQFKPAPEAIIKSQQ